MEKIIKIEVTEFEDDSNSYMFEGFVITTDKQIIKMGITNEQACCENWGTLMTEDNISEFIGSDLIDISSTDVALSGSILNTLESDYINLESCMFINLNTTEGVLQFVIYNDHNGYYSHDVIVRSEQLTIDTSL